MRAAIITTPGASPVVGEFTEPVAARGEVLIRVDTAGLGGWDVLGAYRLAVNYPCVLRGEGVGLAEDGRRVYFGERSTAPFGAWAERTIVPPAEVWNVPDDVDDRTAITMAIAGTGAYVPLLKADIQRGDAVLVTGASGAVGQLALQFARVLGAGRVVAAGRDPVALALLKARGWADATVLLGGPDDVEAMKAAAGDGFDVVLDIVCGDPLLAAMKATRWGARIVTIGKAAGGQIAFEISDLLFRTLSLVGTGQRPAAERESIWRKLLELAREQAITVDYAEYPFGRVADAWAAQSASPRAKIISSISASAVNSRVEEIIEAGPF